MQRAGFCGLAVLLLGAVSAFAAQRLGVPPRDAWTCPPSHPIKGNLTTRTGECIYHPPRGSFYHRTKPEMCFATEEDARKAGCRKSKR